MDEPKKEEQQATAGDEGMTPEELRKAVVEVCGEMIRKKLPEDCYVVLVASAGHGVHVATDAPSPQEMVKLLSLICLSVMEEKPTAKCEQGDKTEFTYGGRERG